MAVKRKPTTKRKSSSVRVAKKKRGISKVQALVLVVVLAAIGLVAVALTRASGTPNYQYSWSKYCVAAQGSSSASEVKKCKQTSAEAIVYRLYRGIYDRNPDDGGYKFWTQKFAGDRAKVGTSALVAEGVAKMGSDTAFVKAVYRNMLDREATDKEMVAWRTKIKEKKLTREQMVVQFAVGSEAIRKNEARWTTFSASAPKVNVVQTAAQEQRKRFDAMLLEYQQPSKSDMNVVSGDVAKAEAQYNAANATAGKRPPSANDLKSIANNQSQAQAAYNHAKARAAVARGREAAAKRALSKSQELANFATDIRDSQVYGIGKIQARYNATKTYAATAESKANGIKSTVSKIADKYAIAEKKYEDEQARLEAIRIQKEREQRNADQLRAERARLDRLPLYADAKPAACESGAPYSFTLTKTNTRAVACRTANGGYLPDKLKRPICYTDYYPVRHKVAGEKYQVYFCQRN